MDRQRFENLVQQALENLPVEFAQKLENIAIVVEDFPSLSQLSKLNLPPQTTLFGLYEGVPKINRSGVYTMVPPDKITIFQKPIEYLCKDEEAIKNQVRKTVLHEIGHHFGLKEEELRKRGI